MGKATQDLRKEHDSILHVLKILDKMMSTDQKEDIDKLKYYSELVYFLKIFADKCHHGKEEKYFFVELANRGIPDEGGLIGSLLQEHNQSREYVAMMGKALESKDLMGFNTAAAKYGDLLKSHIEKENNILFAKADQLLDEEMQAALFEKFEQHEESVIGHGVHEELHSMIHKWATEFDVD
jgi:hemerythrin-like domain-containing protein